MSAADALRLVESFHNDPSRQVLERALTLALSFGRDVVPDDLRANYQRFLAKNFEARARELGWIPKPIESEEVKLVRPALLKAVATFGGNEELARQAHGLTDKWLMDRKAVAPDVVDSILVTTAYYGDTALYQRFLTEFERIQDRQAQQSLLEAMTQFRDPAALQLGMRELLAGKVKLIDGFLLLFGGLRSPATRKLPFDFIKAHFDELMNDNPSIFGFSFGAFLPNVGRGFCDAESLREFRGYFTPLVSKYDGAPRNFAQVVESVELCIARVAAQRPSIYAFLKER